MSGAIPESIDRYRVLRAIARGGMAEVYEVEEPTTGDHVALKLLLNTDSELERFNREYEMMNQLNHPNVVRVYHYGLVGNLPWITMELIEGTPVQSYAKSLGKAGTRRRTLEVVRVGHDLARALDYIHTRGILHRDLKSANVLVLPDGRVKLLDFGAARFVTGAKPITREGEFLGTFAYASPEQIRAQPLDHRSDLYAFGVLLYRMLTARLPFKSTDYHELARMQVHAVPPRPSERIPNIDPRLEELILQLLEKDREARPSSGAEVAERLEAIAGTPLGQWDQLTVANDTEGSLAGREDQIASLRKFVARAAPGSVAILHGAEGSGRERILKRALADVAERNWDQIQCTVNSRRPVEGLFAELEAIGRSMGTEVGPKTAAAMRALEEAREKGLPAEDRGLAIFGIAMASLLAERATALDSPTLVVLRNADLGGLDTARLVEAIGSGLRRLRAQVFFLLETEEAGAARKGVLRERLPDATRVPLPPLGEREVARLVGALLLRRPPPVALARRIHQASGGMPMYVEQVVRAMVQAGQVRSRSQEESRLEWTLDESTVLPVPSAAEISVRDQLAEVPKIHRRVLEALAMLAGDATAELIAAALGQQPGDLVPVLVDMSTRGWVHLQRPSRVTWRQPLLGKVILEDLSDARRQLIRRALLPHLVRMPPGPPQVQMLLAAGYHKQAVERALPWVRGEIEAGRLASAKDLLYEVMRALEGVSGIDPATRVSLFLFQARTLVALRPMEKETSALVAKLKGFPLNSAQKIEYYELEAELYRETGRHAEHQDALQAAWEYLEAHPHPLAAARIADRIGRSLILAGNVADAKRWHILARKASQETGEPRHVAAAEAGVAEWQYVSGQLTQAQMRAGEATRIFQEHGDLQGLSRSLPVWLHCVRQRGRFSEGIDVIHHELPRLYASESEGAYARILLAYGWLEADIGRLGRAQELLDELGATLGSDLHLDLRLQADLLRGRILMESGNSAESNALLSGVLSAAEHSGLRVLQEQARAYLGATLWDDRQYSEAERLFKEAKSALRGMGHVPATLEACMTLSKWTRGVLEPNDIFEPVAEFIQGEPAETAKLEWLFAIGRHQRKFGVDSTEAYRTARKNLAALAEGLNPTDRAALRVHTWSREIGIGLDSL